MCISTTYKVIDPERGVTNEQTHYYMMNCLLYSRMESSFPSNDEYYDEDVNVYIANLLSSLIDPKYQTALNKYIFAYDVPLFESINRTDSPRVKYMTYKVNADFILVSLGIFMNPARKRPNSTPHMNLPMRSYIGRGKAYYNLAQSYSMATFRRNTAVCEVLGKLSTGFERYTNVLSHMRGEYFNIYKRFTGGEIYHLERSIEVIEQKGKLKILYDKFLDAYSIYKQKKNPESKKLLEEIIIEIKRLDPTFRFSIK